MNNIAIKAENLSKAYQLGEIGTGTISRDLERWWAKTRGKEDPFLRIGEANNRSVKGTSDVVWSLKDIDFEIKQGDAVGIIGRNGAGKSTLLKVLSRVTSPTTGSVKVKGRIASLLEVGTGFHPELTGRENIFLNGAILGMRKYEIKKHFDAIVDFAGVERYIDTPVKRYSSGMYVRLAFAVAAHLESEILIVDEVLAVGDAEFQRKCLGKMGEVSKGEGRTVLFVSHNMSSIMNLCQSSMLMKHGQLLTQGPSETVIADYMLSDGEERSSSIAQLISKRSDKVEILEIQILQEGQNLAEYDIAKEICIEVDYKVKNSPLICTPSIVLKDKYDVDILASFNSPSASLNYDKYYGVPLAPGTYKARVLLPKNFLNAAYYKVDFYLSDNLKDVYTKIENYSFSVLDTGDMSKEYSSNWLGVVRPKLQWETEIIE